MTRRQQPALTYFAIAMIGLGIIALVYGDFALVWQPVPTWVPGRTALAYLSGVLMLVCGAGLLIERTATLSAKILFPYLVVWTLLKVPALFVAPGTEGVWLGIGELLLLMTGGWILYAKLAELEAGSKPMWLTSDQAIRVAQLLFGVALIPIGLSHLVYLQDTAGYVPAWLPFRPGWAYLTGAGHIAAGLGVLFGVVPRLAAMMEATMISIFTLLVWLPPIFTAPKERMSYTAFFISWALGAGAWCVAYSIRAKTAAKP